MSVLGTRKRRLTALVATVALIGIGGGAAFAFWSGSGTGIGTATTGISTNFAIASLPSDDPALTPGGPAQTVEFTVTNPGTAGQNLTSVVVTVANADGSVWLADGCSAADYTVGNPVIAYGQLAGGGGVDGTVTVAMSDLDANQDGCQGVAAPLHFAAS
jgi:hypothetical protein